MRSGKAGGGGWAAVSVVVATVLARRFSTLRNEGNLNNEIGLPLTLLRLGPEHEAAVLEMGMYVGGEIADLARMARPSIGVVTAEQSPEFVAAAEDGLVPTLESLGHEVAVNVTLPCPEGDNDCGSHVRQLRLWAPRA